MIKGMKRGLTITASAIAIFTALATPVYAINIWENAYCGGSTKITTGGPPGPCTFCDGLQVAANVVALLRDIAMIGAVLMVVVGALQMLFAAGSPEKFATGRKTIQSAIIGLAIALVSWLVVAEVFHLLSGVPSAPWNQIDCG